MIRLKYLVTGGVGFIGFHTAKKLKELGNQVVVIDNFSDYYDVKLKNHRAKLLKGIKIYNVDIADFDAVDKIFKKEKFDRVCHLAAQAGVRYSMINPHIYIRTNIQGTLNILECAKKYGIKDVVLASSSSVYGKNKKIPFSEDDKVDTPVSLYAQTKRSNELLGFTYHHLAGMNITCLRFFNVYGPHIRPDMAPWLFTKNILADKPINVFNYGKMKRDFTYVADIVDGIVKALEKPMGYQIINLGNNKPVELTYVITLIEKNLGKTAKKNMLPMQPGDVENTWADISKAKKLLGWQPTTSIEDGMAEFIKWYKEYHNLK